VVVIIAPEIRKRESEFVMEATPEMFKAYWPDVRGSYLAHHSPWWGTGEAARTSQHCGT